MYPGMVRTWRNINGFPADLSTERNNNQRKENEQDNFSFTDPEYAGACGAGPVRVYTVGPAGDGNQKRYHPVALVVAREIPRRTGEGRYCFRQGSVRPGV